MISVPAEAERSISSAAEEISSKQSPGSDHTCYTKTTIKEYHEKNKGQHGRKRIIYNWVGNDRASGGDCSHLQTAAGAVSAIAVLHLSAVDGILLSRLRRHQGDDAPALREAAVLAGAAPACALYSGCVRMVHDQPDHPTAFRGKDRHWYEIPGCLSLDCPGDCDREFSCKKYLFAVWCRSYIAVCMTALTSRVPKF